MDLFPSAAHTAGSVDNAVFLQIFFYCSKALPQGPFFLCKQAQCRDSMRLHVLEHDIVKPKLAKVQSFLLQKQ